MSKPVPSRELVTRQDNGIARRLFITPYSGDATQWLTDNAPQFGQFFKPIAQGMAYTLFVSDGFNPQEVAQYLESYNEDSIED